MTAQAQSKELLGRQEHWPLLDEPLEIFRMGDRNGDGHLDMNELTELRQSAEFAQAMLDPAQAMIERTYINKTGRVSRGEWLAYVKRLADNDEESTSAALALYRHYFSNNSIALGVAVWREMEVLDEGVEGSGGVWCVE